MRTIPDDIARCCAGDCPARENCLRWVYRNSGIVHFEGEHRGKADGCNDAILMS